MRSPSQFWQPCASLCCRPIRSSVEWWLERTAPDSSFDVVALLPTLFFLFRTSQSLDCRDEGVAGPEAFADELSGHASTFAFPSSIAWSWVERMPLYATRHPRLRKAASVRLSRIWCVTSFVALSGLAGILEFTNTSGQCGVSTLRDPILWPLACAREFLLRPPGSTQPRWYAGLASSLQSRLLILSSCFYRWQSGTLCALDRLCERMLHILAG